MEFFVSLLRHRLLEGRVILLRRLRQAGPKAKGAFVTYDLKNISTDSSFLEMLDVLNEQLVANRQEPIAFDHDCREGICGMCRSILMATLTDQT